MEKIILLENATQMLKENMGWVVLGVIAYMVVVAIIVIFIAGASILNEDYDKE